MIVFNAETPSKWDEFSNMRPATVVLDGITYPTTEHAYQAQKTEDEVLRRRIAGLPTPYQAKRAARTLMLRDGWEEMRFGVMVRCLREKFKIPKYRALLLETGDEEIAESAAGWDDRIWGLGRSGNGRNLLGKALMQVRSEIRQVGA